MIIPRRIAHTLPGEFTKVLRGGKNISSTIDAAGQIAIWETTFAKYIGCNHGIAVGSGRQAMQLILSSLNLPAGSEVIIPAYTLKDLIPIIKKLYLIPVPADIDPGSWNISPETISQRITSKTKAILVLHLFGNPAPMEEIVALAKKHNIQVIEDCAHSAGSTINDRQTGSFGDAAFFSFETIKPINTYGGGMIVTSNKDIADNIRKKTAVLTPLQSLNKKLFAVYLEKFLFSTGLALIPLAMLASKGIRGLAEKIYRKIQHAPSRPLGYSPLQAILGLEKLKTLEIRIKRRRELAEQLNAILNVNLKPQREIPGGKANYYFYVLKGSDQLEILRKRLLRNGIDAGIYDEIADDCAAVLNDVYCPVATYLFEHAIHLPLHEEMNKKQLEKIAKLLTEHVKKYA